MTLEIRWKPSQKQLQAFEYLTDRITTELLYGGGAGGGKSYLGCVWLVYSCLAYPGTRYLMGRAILKTLKDSTLLTFFNTCKQFNLVKGIDYKYNYIQGIISFTNGSEIYLKDLYAYPSDPEFDELGSTEYTGAFIDEASQVTEKAYQIVMSRLRFRLDEYGIVPKLLTATNPTKNFLYADFYKPWRDNQLITYRKFIQALVGDNPYAPTHYIENLKKLNKNSKERLLYGNWEYDDDPSRLFDYDQILDTSLLREALGVAKSENDCFLCYTLSIREEEIESESGTIPPTEIMDYLRDTQYPKIKGTTYLNYIQSYEHGGPGRVAVLDQVSPRGSYGVAFLAKNKKESGGIGWVEGLFGTVFTIGAVTCYVLEPCGLVATSVVIGSGLGAGGLLGYKGVQELRAFYESDRTTSAIVFDNINDLQANGCLVKDIAGK